VEVLDFEHQPTAPFEAHAQELLGLNRELHGQLLEDLATKAVHDHRDRVLFGDAPLAAVEELVFADLGGGRLVLDLSGRVLHLDVGKRVRSGVASEEERVALGVVLGALRGAEDLYEPAVGVLPMTGRDRLGDDGRVGVLADVGSIFVPCRPAGGWQ